MTYLRKKNKQHKDLRSDPRYAPKAEPTKKIREKRITDKEWDTELSKYKKGQIEVDELT